MLDAMAIRTQVTYDSHAKKLVGFIDLGTNAESEDQAKEALVFMVVGMRAKWKAPIAYYLTRTLTAVAQTELLLACLSKLLDLGFKVHTVTFDGHASNVSMCNLLGCSFDVTDELKTYFHVPGYPDRIWAIMDACHMVKCVRTALEAYGTFTSPNGTVRWNLIKDLHFLQDGLGLRLANKLSLRHVNFKNQKMKVNFAFSLSLLPLYYKRCSRLCRWSKCD